METNAGRPIRLLGILTVVAALGLGGTPARTIAQDAVGTAAYPGTESPAQRNRWLERGDGEVHVLLVREGDRYPEPEASIYLLFGAGGNITVQVGPNGVLLVNSGKASMSDKVLAAIHSLSSEPLRTIINTDVDPEDSGGNQAISATGRSVTGGDVTNLIGSSSAVASVISSQEVLDRMSASGTADSQGQNAWPTDTYTLPTKDMWFDGESIRIFHQQAAHTDGDSMVYFRHSDVVCTGDIYSTTGYPVFDIARGGSIQGIIDGLNRLIYEIMIPAQQNDGGTLVIPNRGYLSSYSDVVFYQEMVIIIRDRIRSMIGKGMTLEQIQAARPTFEFDPRYGSTTGPWTTRMFVEAVYNSLKARPKAHTKTEPAGP
jgi:glyoxylase-like metal-dependent hydrolase (beta-lactamase superfamily II)